MTDLHVPDEWDAFLERVDNDPDSVGADEMTIADLDRANWAMDELARIARHLEDVDAAARERIARTNQWVQSEHERVAFRVALLESRLKEFHRQRYAADQKGAKTVRLVEGRLESNAGQPAWEYPDEAKFLEWAEKHRPHLVRRPEAPPESPDKNKVKAEFKDSVKDGVVVVDGDVVPGLVVKPAERKYTIAPDLTRDGAR